MPSSVYQRAFAGGELAPALWSRADLAKYQQGLRVCQNFLVQRHGGVANRPGLRFISACKTTSSNVKLIRYVSEVEGQSLLLELGAGYVRFFLNGAPVTVDLGDIDAWDGATDFLAGDLVQNGGVVYYAKVDNTGVATSDTATWHPMTGTIYEVPIPFGSGQLPHSVQSGRVITLTHHEVPPTDLVFAGLTHWLVRPIVTTPTIDPPTSLVLTPGDATAGARNYGYVVTSTAADGQESIASMQVVVAGVSAATADAPNVLTWTAAPDALEYNVYCDTVGGGSGVYAYIGTTAGTTFNDGAIVSDPLITPPLSQALFATAGDYPLICAYHQQRRFFANTLNEPDTIWASRTGYLSNFSISTPMQDDDALQFRIAGNNHHAVRGLIALRSLIVLTQSGEWTVGAPHQPLTPSALDAEQETYVGISEVPAVVVGNAILYVQAREAILHDLQFDQQVEGLGGRDLSVYAAHLFEGHGITEIDYQQTPQSITWATRDDGLLLGLTYLRDQEVWGWHWHLTGGNERIDHVCVVPEVPDDALYVIVRRTIGGGNVRYIERLEERLVRAATFDADAFFVDSGLTYSGAPATTITGLGHLNGRSVVGLADGTPVGPFTVSGGSITLPAAASTVHVGLPIVYPEIELLDLDVQGSDVRDKAKRVGSVTLLLDASSRGFLVGSDRNHLIADVRKPYEPVSDLFTGPVEVNISATWNVGGRLVVRQPAPLPLTIIGVLPNLAMGG